MWIKTLFVLIALIAGTLSSGFADRALDEEPVLRLRLQDQTPAPVRQVKLRPRFDAGVTVRSQPVPMPRVRVQDTGAVGTFAYVSTPHPNVVVAIGSSEDRTEVGRQIDRALIDMGGTKPLFDHGRDRSPFIGVGVQAQVAKTGWAMDASLGANFVNRAEQTRLFGALDMTETAALEAEARANFRLRYRF